jgi:hypothetical protein
MARDDHVKYGHLFVHRVDGDPVKQSTTCVQRRRFIATAD